MLKKITTFQKSQRPKHAKITTSKHNVVIFGKRTVVIFGHVVFFGNHNVPRKYNVVKTQKGVAKNTTWPKITTGSFPKITTLQRRDVVKTDP